MAFSLAVALALFLQFTTSCASDALEVNLNDVAFTTSPSFVSFNFDWWPNTSPGWTNSSVLVIELKNPLLVYLTSQLSPGHLRIGGSDEDRIVFDVGTNHEPCKEPFCMNMSKWEELVNFTQITGTKLAFGINAMYGRKNKTSPIDPSNAEALMKYTAQNKMPVAAFEFGNELNHEIDPVVYGKDFKTMRTMINQIWPDESTRPLLVGPDIGISDSYFESFLPVAGPYLNATTYHVYSGYGLDPKLADKIPTVDFLQSQTHSAMNMVGVMKDKAPNVDLWVGESAAAWHSGQDGTTNTFLSGFWYLNALGTTATNKHKAFCRQTLVGGHYELLNKTTYMPNPDYYTALLYRKLMGQKMLDVTVPSSMNDSVTAHAACAAEDNAKGAIVLAFVNVDKAKSFELPVTGIASGPREEYHLTTGEEGNYRSHKVMLNNKLLEIENGKLPDLSGMSNSGETPLVAKPMSYGFAIFKNANAKACM